MFDKDIYFASVRSSLFSGSMNQGQVEGQEAILDTWSTEYPTEDLRWLAYMLATTYHETSKEMQPIEEYGKGSGMSYGKPDPETGQTYYGRGFVQLTWRENYAKADRELQLSGDESCEWFAENALKLGIASSVMFIGMIEGWFRKSSDGRPQNLERYFDADTDDAYTAREIINGDKTKVPSWSNGVSIGNLIKGYHVKFLSALQAAWSDDAPVPVPPEPPEVKPMEIGEMVQFLWAGEKTARAGWNGRNMYLELQRPDANSKMTLPYVYMRTAQGDLVPWLCSQTDLLANDWVIVP